MKKLLVLSAVLVLGLFVLGCEPAPSAPKAPVEKPAVPAAKEEAAKPDEEKKAEAAKPVEEKKAEAPKPVEEKKAEAPKPVEEKKAEAPKPAEEKK